MKNRTITDEDIAIIIETRKTCMSKKMPYLQFTLEIANALNIVIRQITEDSVLFCEIGLLNGSNFSVIGNVLQRHYVNVRGIGVDLPGIKEYAGAKIDPNVTIKEFPIGFHYNLVLGDSTKEETIQQVKDLIESAGRPIDFLFIDGDHSYKGCMADFNNYSPFVRKGGIIGFHDLGENRFDVRTKVWPEIIAKYKQNWEFVVAPGECGIGIIIKDK